MKMMLAALASTAALATLVGSTGAEAQAPAPAPAATPSPAWESLLRQTIDQMQRGQPDYDRMSPALVDATHQQLAQIQQAFTQLGKLTAVKFEQTTPEGMEIYTVTFEHGTTQWGIFVGADGKIAGLGFKPA